MPSDAGELAVYHDHIRRCASRIVVALNRGPHDAAVPACPGWTLVRLVEHLGRVHQWATAIVRTGTGPNHETTGLGPYDDPTTWYMARVERLVSTLAETDPARECWTLVPTHRTAAFWSRRQAHELAMHQIDAVQAIGEPASYDAELAVDGVAEVLDVLAPRVVQRTGAAPDLRAPLLLRCTDRPERWVVRPGPGAGMSGADPATAGASETSTSDGGPDWEALPTGRPDPEVAATVEAPAQTLLLSLWKRPVAEPPRLRGDREVAEAFLASRLTP